MYGRERSCMAESIPGCRIDAVFTHLSLHDTSYSAHQTTASPIAVPKVIALPPTLPDCMSLGRWFRQVAANHLDAVYTDAARSRKSREHRGRILSHNQLLTHFAPGVVIRIADVIPGDAIQRSSTDNQ